MGTARGLRGWAIAMAAVTGCAGEASICEDGGPLAARVLAPGGLEAIVRVGGCTGTLVGPGTVLTAAHCVCPAFAQGALWRRDAAHCLATVDVELRPDGQGPLRLSGSVLAEPTYFADYDAEGHVATRRADLAVVSLPTCLEGFATWAIDEVPVAECTSVLVAGLGLGVCEGGTFGDLRLGAARVDEVGEDVLRLRGAPALTTPGDSGGPLVTDRGIAGVASSAICGIEATFTALAGHAAWIRAELKRACGPRQ